MREWLRANGGPPALVIVGVPLLFAFWPLGAAFIVVGFALSLYRWERFPVRIARKRPNESASVGERRELLSLAEAVRTELETCRYRMVRAEHDHVGWYAEQRLPADAYAKWAPALVTADQTEVNEALRGFYVWANEMNHHMSRVATEEWNAVGREIPSTSSPLLGADTVSPMREGISRVENAQERLGDLIKRLAMPV
jgi:hypothetical protein